MPQRNEDQNRTKEIEDNKSNRYQKVESPERTKEIEKEMKKEKEKGGGAL